MFSVWLATQCVKIGSLVLIKVLLTSTHLDRIPITILYAAVDYRGVDRRLGRLYRQDLMQRLLVSPYCFLSAVKQDFS